MDTLDKLAKIFERFPGIGPRQASRFVLYLLRSSPSLRRELAELVKDLSGAVHQCTACMRYHTDGAQTCSFCKDLKRDQTLLAVVASDADVTALERSGTYKGQYFVLGGTISLASEKADALRMKELRARIQKLSELKEVVLALPATPEGDFTASHVRDELGEHVRVTTLGRGLSTGSELEYADPATLKSAFENRR